MAIDPQLNKIIDYIQGVEIQISRGMFGAAGRPWMNFNTVQVVGQFDYAGIQQLFNRKAANRECTTLAGQRDPQSKALATAKLSGDYLAGLERDYRARTRSRIRTIVHCGNRAAANGLMEGPLYRNSIEWFTRILAEDSAK